MKNKNKSKNKKALSGIKTFKQFFFITTLVLSAFAFLNIVPAKATTVDATLLFNPASNSTTTTGSNVTYTARVNPGSNTVNGTNAVQMDITFVPAVVHLVSLTPVAPFSIMTPQDIASANSTGKISVSLFITGSQVTTTSDLATLVFSPQGAGNNSQITFDNTSDVVEAVTFASVLGTRTGATVTVTVADTTPPVISATAPASNSLIKSITIFSAVSYTLSEQIQSGTIVFTRTGGSADSTIHTCTLKGTALNSGVHNNLDLSDTVNSCTSAQSLVSGVIYSVAFNAIDLAGNTAIQALNTWIAFDNIPPVITSTAPVSNAFIKSVTSGSGVSYTLSETLAAGMIIFTRTGGTADAASHLCFLKGSALMSGAHSNIDLSDTNNSCAVAQSLVSGAVYTVTFDATDLAGNPGFTTVNTGVGITFDNIPPVVTQVTPPPVITRANVLPSFTFHAPEAGNVVYGGDCSGTPGSAVTATDIPISFTNLPVGNHANCIVQITDLAGNVGPVLSVPSFAVTYKGDLNITPDRAVNITDLSILASDYGRTGWAGHTTDIGGDGNVNITDLSILATDFGRSF